LTELIKERQKDAKTVLSFPQSPSFSHVILHICYNMMVEAQTKKYATNSTTSLEEGSSAQSRESLSDEADVRMDQ